MTGPSPRPTRRLVDAEEPEVGWPQIHRSPLDRRVWVPQVGGGDMVDTRHAGGLRVVKRWVEETYADPPVRWVRVDDDVWEMRDQVNGEES